jgi:hypothetical protein
VCVSGEGCVCGLKSDVSVVASDIFRYRFSLFFLTKYSILHCTKDLHL